MRSGDGVERPETGMTSLSGFDDALRRELTANEKALLMAIWEGAFGERYVTKGELGSWQTWDYVSRIARANQPTMDSSDEILAQLPVVAVPNTSGRRYGWVWLSEGADSRPAARIVGLSIAGLARLAESQPEIEEYANQLVWLVNAIARADAELTPLRNQVAEKTEPLRSFVGIVDWLESGIRSSRYRVYVPGQAVGQILQREYAPLSVVPSGAEHDVSLGRADLRPYETIISATDYLDYVATEAQLYAVARAWTPSPLTLVQTIDYLAYVLRAHHAWPGEHRFVDAPDLNSATQLGMEIVSKEQFESATNSLWNIISHLDVPPVPAADLKKNEPQPGSIGRLQRWLTRNLDGPSVESALRGLNTVRDVGTLRTGFAHSSESTQAKAARAQQNLGLPAFIVDWPGAWLAIRARTAKAFDEVRLAVQQESPDLVDQVGP